MRKIKRSSLVAKLDARFSEYIKKRDRRCVICGSTSGLQTSHYYGKGAHYSTRWDEINSHAFCAGCHLRHHNRDPEMYRDWMHERYGEETMDALRLRANIIRKFTDSDIAELVKLFEAKIKRLEGMWL